MLYETETKELIPFDIDEIYNEWKSSNNKESEAFKYNHNKRRSSRRSYKRFNLEDIQCLNDDEIEEDLTYLLSEAAKNNITIIDDVLIFKKRNKRKRGANYRLSKEINVDDTEMKEIETICKEIGIDLDSNKHKALTVKLYNYPTHLKVYEFIRDLVIECDEMERDEKISELKSNALRDIQAKLRSAGTVGVKLQMATGIKHTLNFLAKKCLR